MKNTVTMAELMKQVEAFEKPQNLDEGFASDAQRRAAFAQGYTAKGKKDKKDEEVLDEAKATLSRFGGDRLKSSIMNLAKQRGLKVKDLGKDKIEISGNGKVVMAITLAVQKKDVKINEEVELDEAMKYTHVAVDSKGKLIGLSTKESDAVDMARRNKGKALKLMKPISQKKGDMMVNRTLGGVMGDAQIVRNFMEEVELDENASRAFDDLIKTGGVDKKDFQKAKQLYMKKDLMGLRKFIYNLDTDPLESIMDIISTNDSKAFMKMYPKSKKGEYMSSIAHTHKEEVDLVSTATEILTTANTYEEK